MFFLMTIENAEERLVLEQLYELYHKDVYWYAYKKVGDHEVAQDLMQDTFLRANRHLDVLTDIEGPKTRSYLVTIVRNLSVDYFRRDRLEGKYISKENDVEELVNVADVDELIEKKIITKETRKSVSEVLGEMYEPYGDILRLRYFDELEYSEIADVLNITKNNTHQRMKRALESFEKIVKERSDLVG